jgi:hypothetical protein
MIDYQFSRPGQVLLSYSRVFVEKPHYIAKIDSIVEIGE